MDIACSCLLIRYTLQVQCRVGFWLLQFGGPNILSTGLGNVKGIEGCCPWLPTFNRDRTNGR